MSSSKKYNKAISQYDQCGYSMDLKKIFTHTNHLPSLKIFFSKNVTSLDRFLAYLTQISKSAGALAARKRPCRNKIL